MSSPHQVTRDFEQAVAEYCGAPYCVAVNSCTSALLLAVGWSLRRLYGNGKVITIPTEIDVEIPRRTYVSVPMAIAHAGGKPVFRDEDWSGAYQLKPLPVWDSARWFTSGLWTEICSRSPAWRVAAYQDMPFAHWPQFVCVSFHASKTLGIEQGGAILHGDKAADAWFRKARFDGRTEGVAPIDDTFDVLGHHCYMNPSTAAQGLLKLHSLPKHNAPLPNDNYPDLSKAPLFQ